MSLQEHIAQNDPLGEWPLSDRVLHCHIYDTSLSTLFASFLEEFFNKLIDMASDIEFTHGRVTVCD